MVRFMFQQALLEFIHSGAPEKDQVVTVLGLSEEQPMLTERFAAFALGEERSECGQPLKAALQYIACDERIGQFLQLFGMRAAEEGVFALFGNRSSAGACESPANNAG